MARKGACNGTYGPVWVVGGVSVTSWARPAQGYPSYADQAAVACSSPPDLPPPVPSHFVHPPLTFPTLDATLPLATNTQLETLSQSQPFAAHIVAEGARRVSVLARS